MTHVTRKEIFAQAAKKLRNDFEELSTTIVHSGVKGGEAEDLVRRFLQGHLPKRFDAGSGFIIDPRDGMSKQIDVIVYDALNCPVYRASEKAAIIPSDNVAAVVEVKSRLDKEKMRDAFKNAHSVKSLAKSVGIPLTKRVGEPDLQTDYPSESDNRLVTLQTLYCLFVFETPLTLEKLSEHYHSGILEFGLGRHIDMVFVLDKGIIMLAMKPANVELGWHPGIMEGFGGPHSEGAHIAVAAIPIKEEGLDFFLRFLLAQLIHFRAQTGHPGFWLQDRYQMKMTYLTSITHEKDPARRNQNLQRYADEVRAEFQETPVNKESSGDTISKGKTTSDLPDVICLPGPKDATA